MEAMSAELTMELSETLPSVSVSDELEDEWASEKSRLLGTICATSGSCGAIFRLQRAGESRQGVMTCAISSNLGIAGALGGWSGWVLQIDNWPFR